MLLGQKMLSRRPVILFIVFSIFVGALLSVSVRLETLCLNGIYCGDSLQTEQRPHADGYLHSEETKSHGEDRLSGIALNKTSTFEFDCAHFPDTSNILLVMKTGASEAYIKVPTQLVTNLKCLPEFLIFSDKEQKIAGYSIYDSLDKVLESVKLSNKDFDIYFRQQECGADQESCNKHADTASEGWALDKYKNVHIAEKTFKMRPNYDWYLFVDADTYVVWPTLVEWLKKLKPSKPLYFGSVAMLGGFPFGHGGSGYLVSKTAMQTFLEGKTDVANHWDEETKGVCCGDVMFAKALKEATGIDVKNTWPTINGEKPFTIPYSKQEWCQPIATMHHVGSEELSDLYAFEQERKFASPMRFKDLYHRFISHRLAPSRPDWDNLSDDVFYLNASAHSYEDWELKRAKKDNLSKLELEAHLSFYHCQMACEADEGCLQYRFHKGICGISEKIKHGHPTKKEEKAEDQWTSGWVVDRIRTWVRDHDKCGNVVWPLPGK